MEPFTDYAVLRWFSMRAEGDFSYLWYGGQYTEMLDFHPSRHHRTYSCVSAANYPAWRNRIEQ